MIIKSARFVKGAVKPGQFPMDMRPDIAFAGRSNVGKSSLINALVNRKHLVKTSATPGRTQQINFFIVNEAFFLVDLPGYGYARAPEVVRNTWKPMVERYISTRKNLRGVVLVLDIRRTPGSEERDFATWLDQSGVGKIIVLTKADKIGGGKHRQRVEEIAAALNSSPAGLTLFSSKTREGKEALWAAIEKLLYRGTSK
jgi:GTP-binding protein